MLNNLNDRWDLLVADHLSPVFQLYDARHPLDFYIGKGVNKQKLLLLVTPEEPPAIRDMRAVKIQKFRRDDNKWSLLLTLESTPLDPMFSLLCDDLIEASRNLSDKNSKALSFVLRRLSNWRRLLESGFPDLLREHEVRGLCGELLYLQKLFYEFEKKDAVKSWVGPQRADQDFQMPSVAWEVKTIRPGAGAVTISSEFQLNHLERELYLIIFEIADCMSNKEGAFTLNSLVEDIRAYLEDDHDACDCFEEKLLAARYMHRTEYNDQILVVKSFSIYSVLDDFPCITPDSLDVGVANVSYSLALPVFEKFRIQ